MPLVFVIVTVSFTKADVPLTALKLPFVNVPVLLCANIWPFKPMLSDKVTDQLTTPLTNVNVDALLAKLEYAGEVVSATILTFQLLVMLLIAKLEVKLA